jgi:hypothetical protein
MMSIIYSLFLIVSEHRLYETNVELDIECLESTSQSHDVEHVHAHVDLLVCSLSRRSKSKSNLF